MFLNPIEVIREGILRFPDNLPEQTIEELNDTYMQQNGIDITCDRVFATINALSVPFIGKESKKPLERVELPTLDYDGKKCWFLRAGNSYEFESDFYANVPENTLAEIKGRSTFNRNGILIRSGLYDAGFSNNCGATIYCFTDVYVEVGTRIAQFIAAEGESAKMYQGQYQGETQEEVTQ